MKVMTLLALFAAFASPAIGAVVNSKQGGKAHCGANNPDQLLKIAGVQGKASAQGSNSGSGR
jgi:hypothetical protein